MPSERTHHGDTVVDEYEWLRDKDDPETIAYLEAENAYTEARTAHLAEPARATIFEEIKARTQETDLSVPDPQGRLVVLHPDGRGPAVRRPAAAARSADGETGPRRSPRTAPPLAGEQVLLDGNELAEGHEFFSLGAFDVSPDGRWLAYSHRLVRRRALHRCGSRT